MPDSKQKSQSKPNQKNTTAIQKKHFELKPEKIRWHCPDSVFKFKSTEEIEPLDKIIGQPRAVEAIKIGSELFSKGYNIFVSGLSGTGRLSTVKKLLLEVSTYCPMTYDYCYVNNFENPDHPLLIKLEKGLGKVFSKAMADSISFMRTRLPKLFEEDRFQVSRRKIIDKYQQKEKDVLHHFDEKIAPFGFVRGTIESEQGISQPEVFPVVGNKPVQIDDIESFVDSKKITKKDADGFKKNYKKFHNEIYDLARIGMKLMLEFRKALSDHDKAAAEIEVNSLLSAVKEKFKSEKVRTYVDSTKKFIVENINFFVNIDVVDNQDNNSENQNYEEDKFHIFDVNVVLDNSKTICAPIITEQNPTYTNLFGTIDRSYDSRGYWRTDFTKIKAGSILKADQGYLIVNALDLFNEPGVWSALQRVLLYDKLEIQTYEAAFQLSQLHLKPEPIDVKVKVIIIGGASLYRVLYEYEKGFKKIFKINAQFDYESERTDELINNYARFIAKLCSEEGLTHCSPDGVAAIVEWAVEHAGSQNRITLKFSDVADILREASYYDKHSKDKRKYINRVDVKNAIENRRFRNNLMDEKLKYYILEGSTLIDTSGERIGQINGLTILDTGILSFGKPARITASISVGSAGIINIEREAEMSGSIHSKGVLILSGILRERFAFNKPLNLTASIAFEQNYGGIDGDSATAAEIYVLLSAISRVPIKQSLAVTGSVNQKGDIQPIGGVNDKIFGFFEICKERGLTGEHGVIIPVQNVIDLMLPEEIVESVKQGKFHIYPISKFEEGIEILMGKPAGELQSNMKYPKETIFGMVEDRLNDLRKAAKDEDKPKKKKKGKAKSKTLIKE